MIPATVSAWEVLRVLVALYGLRVSLAGRARARGEGRAQAGSEAYDLAGRRERLQRVARMRLYERLQTAFCLVHALLLVNALVNMAYPSAPIEQPNVMSSNLAQILIPLLLARGSELVSTQIAYVASLYQMTDDPGVPQ